MALTANQGLRQRSPRNRAPHVARASQRMLSVLARGDKVPSGDLCEEARLSTRELRYATKYLRDHGFPVAVTRTGRSSAYWLEERVEGMQFVADRYLLDALSALTSWYHASERAGNRNHTDLRGMIYEACVGIGRRLGKAPEQVHQELTGDPPVDMGLERIWAEEADRIWAEQIWSDSP